MYTGLGEANNPVNLKQILCIPIKKVGFRGPLITSICVLVLSSLTLIGLAILGIILFMTADNPNINIWGALHGFVCETFGVEWYMEYGYGDIDPGREAWECCNWGLLVSEQSRGGIGNLVEEIAVKVCLDYVGRVGFVVYFYDCKRRLLEKKFDGEQAQGRITQTAKV
ncbi:hypothetical protein EZV62_019890 [Acer yangbiense]|uniref:Uncharacterized protein n=1 Tax=Acer yangbiense TaxID=1000413 RepID=A0A5C7HCE4_9ROSI|nr:hypothetical protein EZV62_019890 [Acer yangbiense]